MGPYWDEANLYHSRHHPQKGQTMGQALQQRAIRYYGMVGLVYLVALMLALGKPGWFTPVAAIGLVLTVALANLAAWVELNGTWAMMVVEGDAFALLSVAQVLKGERQPDFFPLDLANKHFAGQAVQVNYHDRVVRLTRQDWGRDFDDMVAQFGF